MLATAAARTHTGTRAHTQTYTLLWKRESGFMKQCSRSRPAAQPCTSRERDGADVDGKVANLPATQPGTLTHSENVISGISKGLLSEGPPSRWARASASIMPQPLPITSPSCSHEQGWLVWTLGATGGTGHALSSASWAHHGHRGSGRVFIPPLCCVQGSSWVAMSN